MFSVDGEYDYNCQCIAYASPCIIQVYLYRAPKCLILCARKCKCHTAELCVGVHSSAIILLEIIIKVKRPNTFAAAFVTRYITPNSHVHISCSNLFFQKVMM